MLNTRQNVGRVSSAVRFYGPDDPRTIAARQDLAESVIARRVSEEVEKGYGLRAEQASRLIALIEDWRDATESPTFSDVAEGRD